MRPLSGLLLVLTIALTACRTASQKGSPVAGSGLPVASPSSVALPGAVDSADAPDAPSVAESAAADLTTFRDPETGVSFQYPTVWRPAAGQVLVAPEFEEVAGKPRITQEFSPEGSVYASTVLRALTFSYTAQAHSTAAACASLPAKASPGGGPAHTVTYGGRRFTEAMGGDAGMCTHVAAQIDSTLSGTRCLVFERDFVTGCPYVKTRTTPRPLTAGEAAALQRHLDAVMQSVRIATGKP